MNSGVWWEESPENEVTDDPTLPGPGAVPQQYAPPQPYVDPQQYAQPQPYAQPHAQPQPYVDPQQYGAPPQYGAPQQFAAPPAPPQQYPDPQFAQPQYAPPPYAQPPAAQPPAAQPPAAQPPAAQPPYAQPQFAPQQPPPPGPPLIPPTASAPAGPASAGPPATPKKPRRARNWKKIGIATAVTVALVASALVIFDYVTTGGASSPEAAVQTFVDGIQEQDPLLAASVLSPAELPLLADLLTEVGAARSRVGGGSSGTDIPGTKITISRLRLKTKELGPNAARVTIQSGSATAKIRKADLPPVARGALVEWNANRASWSVNVDDYEDNFSNGISAIIVNVDGGWYISPTLTAADMVVSWDRADLKSGDFESFGDATDFENGAEDPQGAIDLLGDAMSSGDPKEVVAALPSDQAQFAVVFSDALDQLINRSLEDSVAGPDRLPKDWFQLKSFDVQQEDGPDGTVRLMIDSARVRVTPDDPRNSDERPNDYRLSGLNWCENRGACYAEWDKKTPLARKINDATGGSLSLIAREVDGGWKIDPVASAFDMATRLLAKVDKGVAEAGAMSLDGKATTIKVGAPATITFDTDGYARVRLATTPGTVYSVVIAGKDLHGEVAFSGKGGERRTFGGSRASNNHTTVNFVADAPTTTFGIGGLLNPGRAATVTAYEIPIQDQPFNQQIQGTLTAPLVLHRVPLADASQDSSGNRTIKLDGNAGGGSIELSVGDESSMIEKGDRVDPWGDINTTLDDGEPSSTEGELDVSTALVAIQGDVGDSYAYRLSPDSRGFEGGRRSGTVTVPAGGTTDLAIDLGPEDTSAEVRLQWSASVDVDSTLWVGTYAEDSEIGVQYRGGDVTLFASGSGAARLSLRNLGNVPAAVSLTITFD